MTQGMEGRVAILGIGREGQVAWRYLRKRFPGKQLTLIAESPADAEFCGQLTDDDSLLIGPLADAGLDGFDLLVRSPGISPYRKSMKHAIENNTKVVTPSTLWFTDHPHERTICITGTKGKSTTSALLAHMLEACGFRVRLAGNIGLPLLACEDREVDWWVIELSSYQLADLRANPDISVILNFSAEHLDWHGSEERYRRDKLRLAMLAADNPVVANAADPVLSSELAGRQNVIWFNSEHGISAQPTGLVDEGTELPAKLPDGLRGAHNFSNTAAALTALRLAGGELPAGLASLPAFQCLPHRLQAIGKRDGVLFVNDSISSTPVATVAALEAFAGRDVTLILGGLDRGLDWSPYMNRFRQLMPQAIIGIPDNGYRIIRKMEELDIVPCKGLHSQEDLPGAVKLAMRLAPEGGVVLLSPGAPSFPRFRDYRDRGQQFAQLCGFSFAEQDPFTAGTRKAAGQG